MKCSMQQISKWKETEEIKDMGQVKADLNCTKGDEKPNKRKDAMLEKISHFIQA